MEEKERIEAINILEEIKASYLDKFENDPHIRSVINVVINEFKLRTL